MNESVLVRTWAISCELVDKVSGDRDASITDLIHDFAEWRSDSDRVKDAPSDLQLIWYDKSVNAVRTIWSDEKFEIVNSNVVRVISEDLDAVPSHTSERRLVGGACKYDFVRERLDTVAGRDVQTRERLQQRLSWVLNLVVNREVLTRCQLQLGYGASVFIDQD